MNVTIVADQETHLLITDGSRYAVIERRSGHLYNCHDGGREAIPADRLSDIGKIVDESDWTDKEIAQTTFDEIVARGNQLAQRML